MQRSYIQYFDSNCQELLGSSGIYFHDRRLSVKNALAKAASYAINVRKKCGNIWEGNAVYMQLCNQYNIPLSQIIKIEE